MEWIQNNRWFQATESEQSDGYLEIEKDERRR